MRGRPGRPCAARTSPGPRRRAASCPPFTASCRASDHLRCTPCCRPSWAACAARGRSEKSWSCRDRRSPVDGRPVHAEPARAPLVAGILRRSWSAPCRGRSRRSGRSGRPRPAKSSGLSPRPPLRTRCIEIASVRIGVGVDREQLPAKNWMVGDLVAVGRPGVGGRVAEERVERGVELPDRDRRRARTASSSRPGSPADLSGCSMRMPCAIAPGEGQQRHLQRLAVRTDVSRQRARVVGRARQPRRPPIALRMLHARHMCTISSISTDLIS